MNMESATETTTVAPGHPAAPTASWTRPHRTGNSAARIVGRAERAIQQEEKALRAIEPQQGVSYSERLEILMDWEGVVEEVREDDFTARLLDRRGPSKVDTDSVEIPFTEVGQTRRSTSLYFRRLPSWTKAMLASAEERAQRWKKSFGVGSDITASS